MHSCTPSMSILLIIIPILPMKYWPDIFWYIFLFSTSPSTSDMMMGCMFRLDPLMLSSRPISSLVYIPYSDIRYRKSSPLHPPDLFTCIPPHLPFDIIHSAVGRFSLIVVRSPPLQPFAIRADVLLQAAYLLIGSLSSLLPISDISILPLLTILPFLKLPADSSPLGNSSISPTR